MKKKKGFTMVELLAVIVIIGILSVVGTVTATNIINKAKREYYKKQENLILLSGKEYYSDYRSKLPKQVGGTGEVTLKTLVGEKYIKPVEGYQNHTCDVDKSVVSVQKLGESNYVYSILMDCDDYNTNKNGSNPIITYLPNSKRSNKAITVEMRVKDDRGISAYNYIVYKLESKEDSEGEIIGQIPIKSEWDGKAGKEPYNKVIKIKLEEDGIYRIRGTAWDNEENATIKDSGVYEIDNTPPDCKKLVINTDYKEKMTGETWTYKNVKLTLDFNQVGEIESWDWETNKDSRKCTWDYITKNEQLDQIVTGKNSSFYYQSNNKPSTKTKTISGEGARQGRITLYDEFGNSCKVTTEKFLIDKTEISSLTLSGSTASGKVTNKAVRLTATPTPSCVRSGYTYIFERNENGRWVEVSKQESNEYTVDVGVNQEIDYQYRVRVITGAGKTKTSSQYRVHIDKIPPRCDTVSFSPNGTSGWVNQNQTVTINPNNSDIYNFDLLRKVNNGAFITEQYNKKGSSSFTINSDGTHILQALGYDEAGNTCSKNSNPYYVDKTAPSTPSATVWYDYVNGQVRGNTSAWTNRTLAWGNYSASDAGSGVNRYEYSTNCSGGVNGTLGANYTYSTTQAVSYCIRAIDNAGNASGWSGAYYFNIDKTPPTCTPSAPTTWVKSATITRSCSDAHSGCPSSIPSITVSTNTAGAVSAQTITDNVGNVASCGNVNVYVDTTPPTCSPQDLGTNRKDGLDVRINCSDSWGAISTCAGATGSYRDYPNQKSSLNSLVAVDAAGNVGYCSAPIKKQWKKKTCTACKTCNTSTCLSRSNCNCSASCDVWKCTYAGTGRSDWTSNCRTDKPNRGGSCSVIETRCTSWTSGSNCPCTSYQQQTSCPNCGCKTWTGSWSWSDSNCSGYASNTCKIKAEDGERWVKNW